jgi:hypothetical protein
LWNIIALIIESGGIIIFAYHLFALVGLRTIVASIAEVIIVHVLSSFFLSAYAQFYFDL